MAALPSSSELRAGPNNLNVERWRSGGKLDAHQEREVADLKARDLEVRQHEAAHLSAAGQYATGGASFTYVTGPDGNRYAVSGEVSIDTSKIPGNPAATIAKAQTLRRAASAPASPSGQDQAVAAAASQMEAQARRELAEKHARELQSYNNAGKKVVPETNPTTFSTQG